MKKFLSLLCVGMLCVTHMFGCGVPTEKPPKKEDRIMHDYAMYDGVTLSSDLWTTVPETIYDEDNDRHDKGIDGTIKAL